MRNPARQLRRMMRLMRPRVPAGGMGRRFPGRRWPRRGLGGGFGRGFGPRFGRGFGRGFGGGPGFGGGGYGPDDGPDGGAPVREPRRPVPPTPAGAAPLPTEDETQAS